MNRIKDDFVPFAFDRYATDEMRARAAEFYALMSARRTVREFSDEPIPEGVLEAAVHTAGTAPSGAHKQPWFFAVIRDPAIKHQIRMAAEQEERENYQRRFTEEWLADLSQFGTDDVKDYIDIAPALIVVFRENYKIIDGEKKKSYYVMESVGIAAGMLIAALHNAGLATLTHTPNPMGFLNQILERPKNEVPILLMPVGYPKPGTRVPNLTRKPLDEIMKIY
jgi:nitroreductase